MKKEVLPDNWEFKPLEEISEVVPGSSPPSSTYNDEGIGLPFFQGSGEFGEKYPEHDRWCSDPNKIALPGDVLVSVRAPVGDTNLCREKSCIGRGLAAVRPNENMESMYIFYTIRALKNELEKRGSGSTFNSITSSELRKFEIPIAPTDEQRAIVEKIEELFSKLETGVSELENSLNLAEQLRTSILNSALTGDLVNQRSDKISSDTSTMKGHSRGGIRK